MLIKPDTALEFNVCMLVPTSGTYDIGTRDSEISRFVTRCADASMMTRAEVDTLCVVGIAIIFSRYTYVDALIAVDAIPSVITSARIRVDRVDTSACGFP